LKSCTHAVKALEPTGVPLDLAAKEYAAAWGLPGGSGLVVEAAREYAKRIPHRLPSKLVPDAVKEMLEAREKGEGASKTVLMPPRWLRTRWEVKLHPAGAKHLERVAIQQGVAKTKNRPVFNRKPTKQTMIVNCKNRPLHGGSGLVVEAAREYAMRIPHRLPSKLVPDAVKEMLEAGKKGRAPARRF
jgi:hypothetical protein